jgi:hypothetical protein
MPRGSSHEVSGSSSTVQPFESTRLAPPGGYLSPYVPSSGFLTLSTVCSSIGLPGLVSCPCAHGVPNPSELFPRPEPWRLSAPCAFLPSTAATGRRPARPSGLQIPVREVGQRGAYRSGFKALLPGASSSRHPPSLRSAERSMLSWVSGPFRVVPRRPRAGMLPPGSSRELSSGVSRDATTEVAGLRHATPAPRSVHKVGSGRAQLRTADPRGVSHLFDLLLG